MRVFRAVLELLDYVFFATVELGKVYETGPFIHNYALAYALHLVRSPYGCLTQKPDYLRELQDLNTRGLYLTPAHPVRVSYRLSQWNTIRETYSFGKKPQSLGYPDWGFARMLAPGSVFAFYVLAGEPAAWSGFPSLQAMGAGGVTYIRLGKFLGKARVRFSAAEEVVQRRGQYTATVVAKKEGAAGEAASRLLLNWRDLPADPVSCTVFPATLPTKLIADPQFLDGDHYVARFEGQQVVLPAGMRFLARAGT